MSNRILTSRKGKEHLEDKVLGMIQTRPDTFSSREIALFLGVGQNRVCEILSKFEKEGIIVCRTTKRVRYWTHTGKEQEDEIVPWTGGRPKSIM